jgi:hypothetical protein
MNTPSWKSILFGFIPFLAMCLSVSVWDRIHPMVLGLPFNLFWLMLWTALTPLCLWQAYRIENARNLKRENWRKENSR